MVNGSRLNNRIGGGGGMAIQRTTRYAQANFVIGRI
jgi:hypothetical protein